MECLQNGMSLGKNPTLPLYGASFGYFSRVLVLPFEFINLSPLVRLVAYASSQKIQRGVVKTTLLPIDTHVLFLSSPKFNSWFYHYTGMTCTVYEIRLYRDCRNLLTAIYRLKVSPIMDGCARQRINFEEIVEKWSQRNKMLREVCCLEIAVCLILIAARTHRNANRGIRRAFQTDRTSYNFYGRLTFRFESLYGTSVIKSLRFCSRVSCKDERMPPTSRDMRNSYCDIIVHFSAFWWLV
jgi:hypothetical protein